jgi:hypothetical protein
MDNITNKSVKEVYCFINNIKSELENKLKLKINLSISLNESDDFSIYFILKLNRELYDAILFISKTELAYINEGLLNKKIKIFIDKIVKDLKIKIKEKELKKYKEKNKI